MKHTAVRTIVATITSVSMLVSPLVGQPVVPVTAQKQAGTSPVKVFILAGQSNMEGQSVVDLEGKDYNDGRGTLVALMRDPVKGSMFKHLKDADGKWVVRDDVWVRYQREGLPLLAGPLALGFSVYGDQHHFGAELQFGNAETYFLVGDALGKAMKEMVKK